MTKVFDRAGSIFPRIFDPASLFDFNHQASNLFLHRLISTKSGHCSYKMRAFPKRFLNTVLKAGKVSGSQTRMELQAFKSWPARRRRAFRLHSLDVAVRTKRIPKL